MLINKLEFFTTPSDILLDAMIKRDVVIFVGLLQGAADTDIQRKTLLENIFKSL